MRVTILKWLGASVLVGAFIFVLLDHFADFSFLGPKDKIFLNALAKMKEINGIHWSNPKGKFAIQETEKAWWVTEPLKESLNTKEFEFILADLANKSLQLVDRKGSWSDYGLEEGADYLVLSSPSGEYRYSFNFGGTLDGKTFVRDHQTEKLYIDPEGFYLSGIGVQQIVNKYLFSSPIGQVKELKVLGKDTEIHLEKGVYGWSLKSDPFFEIGTSEVLRYLDGLNELQASHVFEKKLVPGVEPSPLVKLITEQATFEVSVVKQSKEFVFLSVSGRNIYFQLKPKTLQRMEWDKRLFEDKGRPFEILIQNPTKIEWSEGGNSRTITSSTILKKVLEQVEVGQALAYIDLALEKGNNFLRIYDGDELSYELYWHSSEKKKVLSNGEEISFHQARSNRFKGDFALSLKWVKNIEEIISQ